MKKNELKTISRKHKFFTLFITLALFVTASINAKLAGEKHLIAYALGATIAPFVILVVSQIFKRFRNTRSKYNIYIVVSLFYFLAQLSQLTIAINVDSFEQNKKINTFVRQMQSELPYKVAENGYTVTQVTKLSDSELQFKIVPPIYFSNFEPGGVSTFLDYHQKNNIIRYCTTEFYEWIKKDNVKVTFVYYDLNDKLIGRNTTMNADCID